MTTTIPSTRIRFNRSQMETIVETIERNPNMNKATLSSNYTAAQRSSDWIALSQKLNKDGGAMKSAKKWQKCWSDYKNEVRKRLFGLYHTNRPYLTPLEERVGALMGIEPSPWVSSSRSRALALEISNVESIQDIPVPTNKLEKSTDALTGNESNNSLTDTPIIVTTVKVEPEEVPKKPPEVNESLPIDTVPPVSAPIDLIPKVSQPSDTISVLAGPIDIIPLVSGPIDIIPLVSGPIDLVPLLTGSSDNITLFPKETLMTGLSSVNKINKAGNDIIVFEKTSAKCLSKLQNATVEDSRFVSKGSQTVAEKDTNQSAVSGALKSLSKALETMAENQKAQLAIEERRTTLLEKLINHFCS